MKSILFCLLVSVAAHGRHRLRPLAVDIGQVCQLASHYHVDDRFNEQQYGVPGHRSPLRVSLGVCSEYFVECDMTRNGSHSIRKCPFHGQVFMRGRCDEASEFTRECFDADTNRLAEETKTLAEHFELCAAGSGVYVMEGDRECSRQAILCNHNRKTAIPITCPRNHMLTDHLTCEKFADCRRESLRKTQPLRQYLLRSTCERRHSARYNDPLNPIREHACGPWYVDCDDEPAITYCEPGYVYDERYGCREWRSDDICTMAGVCDGREWSIVPLGNCSSEHIQCSGLRAELYTCKPGFVYRKQSCVPASRYGCDECKAGEKRATEKCDEFLSCKEGEKGSLEWRRRVCETGTGYDAQLARCTRERYCAEERKCQGGESYSITCNTYMYCVGSGYEMYTCPALTRYDPAVKRCVYDDKCRPQDNSSCREGDVLHSSGCQFYTACVEGKFQQFKCQVDGMWNPACAHCNQDQTGVYQPPAICTKGAKKAHESDCEAFYKCATGQTWQYSRCPSGKAFDSSSLSCSPAAGCYPTTPVACHNAMIFFPNSTDCRHLIECVAGAWVNKQCPEGMVYDTHRLGCVLGTVCPDGPWGQGPSPPAPNPPVYAPPTEPLPPAVEPVCKEGETYADNVDCTRFTVCVKGRWANRVCPDGTSFYADKTCKAGWNPQCTGECEEDAKKASGQCGEYLHCRMGEWRQEKCPRGARFENGKCTGTCKPPAPPSYACEVGQTKPVPNDPRKYHVCNYEHFWIVRHCPLNMHFDPYLHKCRVIPTTTTPVYTVPPTTTPQPQPPSPPCNEGATREKKNKKECQEYEMCVHYEWTTVRCTGKDGWKGGKCVTGLCYAPEQCTAGEYRAVPGNCAVFEQCVHAVWKEMPCAPGTHWNSKINTCDHIGNVPGC